MHSFGSDNHSGVHPLILEALVSANVGHSEAYGEDAWTRQAEADVRAAFSPRAEVAFVFNGTGANCVALGALTRPYQSILTAATGHIWVDECGAPGRFTGCQVQPIATPDGKLTPALLQPYLHGFGDVHHSQPHVVYISQSTELGTVYRPAELLALSELVHSYGMLLYMDGARLSNACAALGCSLRALTAEVGVDMVSFGGTKNGLLYGEAVVALSAEASAGLAFARKQFGQLASKMRYVSASFSGYLRNDLWLKNARHANEMARMLAEALRGAVGVELAYPTEANEVFVNLPLRAISALREEFAFYVWDESTGLCRFVTSWDTEEEDVVQLVDAVRRVLGA